MRALLLILALSTALTGCGYRGPLYLPQSKPEAPTLPPPPERPTPSQETPAPK
ncbi:MAG TPA: lipoprotein [Burkholderiales bacterium]